MSTTVWENLFQMLHKMFYNSRTIYYVDQRLSCNILLSKGHTTSAAITTTTSSQNWRDIKTQKKKKSFFLNFHSVFQFEDFINVNVKQSETMRIFQIYLKKIVEKEMQRDYISLIWSIGFRHRSDARTSNKQYDFTVTLVFKELLLCVTKILIKWIYNNKFEARRKKNFVELFLQYVLCILIGI